MVATEWVIDVPTDLASIAPTRAAVRAHMAACGVIETGDAELMVSELVGNAIVHAGSEISVTVQCADGVTRILVHDGSPVIPAPREREPMRPGGHGLRIVEALSRRWGVDPCLNDGKTVWFEVSSSKASRPGPDVS